MLTHLLVARLCITVIAFILLVTMVLSMSCLLPWHLPKARISTHVLDTNDVYPYTIEQTLFPPSPRYIVTVANDEASSELFAEIQYIGRIEAYPECNGEFPCLIDAFEDDPGRPLFFSV